MKKSTIKNKQQSTINTLQSANHFRKNNYSKKYYLKTFFIFPFFNNKKVFQCAHTVAMLCRQWESINKKKWAAIKL